MIALAAALFGLWVHWALFRKNRTAFIAGFCVLFSLIYRIVDVAYVDIAGPIYAIETEKYVGGQNSTPMFVLCCLTLILPLWFFCRPKAVTGSLQGPLPQSEYLRYMSNIAKGVVILVLAVLYVDMVRVGPIPLFAGIDRVEYRDMAGIFHNPAYSMSFLLSAVIGIFTVLPRLQGQRYSMAFVGLFIALQLYWALTGNRASAFVITATFYAIPFSAVAAMNARYLLPEAKQTAWSALVSARVITPLAVIAGVIVLVSLVINSYYDVRGYADPMYQITQRVFVQPVQFWAETWDRAQFDSFAGINDEAFRRVVLDSEQVNTNASILYLMEQSIGYFRTMELMTLGQQYAGGFPEIFFEVFGSWVALPVMLLFGIATAVLARIVASNLVRGRVLTAIMGVYLFYGFTLTYIGGMLNFLLVPSYSLKLGLLVIFFFFERSVLRLPVSHGGGFTQVPSPVPVQQRRWAPDHSLGL